MAPVDFTSTSNDGSVMTFTNHLPILQRLRTARTLVMWVALTGLLGCALAAAPLAAQTGGDMDDLHARYDAALSAEEMMEWSRRMTVAPHHVGAPQTKANAEWMVEQFQSWGFEAEIERYDVLVPFPQIRELSLVEPTQFTARLQEAVIEEDATSRRAVREGLPPFNAYSADGDVTAELVYVNQGVPRDYEELERLGVDVRGKIVIARYGGSWRGIKPKLAAEKGAIGCIIYNDPRDDGYFQGQTYPEGPYKHPRGVQRGSVLDLPVRPGDPLTPDYGATEGAPRIAREDAETIMSIPVLPIGWKDAQPLLEAVGGPVAPPRWRGALPITYHVGPGPAKVRLRLEFDWSLRPAYNVIAKLEGDTVPDQWVMRGNHHDAWVIGGRDPISGLIALLAEAKAVGALAKSGWRPDRTLVYAAWDAEEPGLLGSTEWVEDHQDELLEKLVAYINTDGNGRGFVNVGGSHALEPLVGEVVEQVEDPQTGVSVGERRRAVTAVRDPAQRERSLSGTPLRIGALGSGSDYSPFFQHLGVPSLNVSFGGESGGGEYHTAFDTHDFFRRFVDPGGAYGVALAQVAGRLTLRLAEAALLPFEFTSTAETIRRYVDEVMDLAEAERKAIEQTNRMLDAGLFELAADPTETYVAPEREAPAPHLEWAPLLNALEAMEAASRDAAVALENWSRLAPDELEEVNKLLFSAEHLLTAEEGLPLRPWFRHQIYAPGYYTGYGVKTLPGIREAIEQRDWAQAGAHIRIVAHHLEALSERLREVEQRVADAQGASAVSR